jgi:D-arabinose 5-phosphate isomerase GutQ
MCTISRHNVSTYAIKSNVTSHVPHAQEQLREYHMKKSLAVGLMIAICTFTATAAQAEDNKIQAAGKKVGNAIVWPFKKMGQGLKAMGNGAKKMVGKG